MSGGSYRALGEGKRVGVGVLTWDEHRGGGISEAEKRAQDSCTQRARREGEGTSVDAYASDV